MELIWSNDGVSSEENRNFLQGKPHVDRVENQGREKTKIPTPPRIHEESVVAWGDKKIFLTPIDIGILSRQKSTTTLQTQLTILKIYDQSKLTFSFSFAFFLLLFGNHNI